MLAEPGVLGLVALTLPDEATAILVQGQEGGACPLPLLDCQQPQQGVLGTEGGAGNTQVWGSPTTGCGRSGQSPRVTSKL